MKIKSQKIIVYAEVLVVLFLALRGLLWVINHDISHHVLDNLSEVAVLLLTILFVMARATSKKEVALQKGVATLVVGFAVTGLIFSIVGIIVLLLFLTGAW